MVAWRIDTDSPRRVPRNVSRQTARDSPRQTVLGSLVLISPAIDTSPGIGFQFRLSSIQAMTRNVESSPHRQHVCEQPASLYQLAMVRFQIFIIPSRFLKFFQSQFFGIFATGKFARAKNTFIVSFKDFFSKKSVPYGFKLFHSLFHKAI